MNQFTVIDISNYSQWTGSVLIVISCLSLFYARPQYIRTLGFYGLISVGFQLAQKISTSNFRSAHLNEIGNGFTLAEGVTLSILFFYSTSNYKFKKMVVAFLSLFIIFYVIVFLFFITNSFSLIRFGRDLLMIILSLSYFYFLIQKLPEENLLRFPMFWINSAIIFFFSGTLILSFMRDYIVYVLKNDMSGFWAFRNFFRFFFCLILSYAGWLNLKQLKPH